MIATNETPPKVWTEEELESLPDDGFNHEVVDGNLVLSQRDDFQHANICGRLLFALESFSCKNRLGVVLGSSTGFWMFNRNCRAPDVSFIPSTSRSLEIQSFQPTVFPRRSRSSCGNPVTEQHPL